MNRPHTLAALLTLGALSGCGSSSSPASPADSGAHDAGGHVEAGDTGAPDAGGVLAVKVMIVNMDILEALPFTSGLSLSTRIVVPGLSSSGYVQCNADDVCEVLLGMGYANAASSIVALLHSPSFDLTHTYFIIAGIAGIDPAKGTIGSAAWARYVVDIGLAQEIDAREMPSGWPYGYFGLGATSPSAPPKVTAGTEVYQLDEALLQQAYSLSRGVKLGDDAQAKAFRAHYPSAPANQAPTVLQCDTTSSDTWFAGTALNQRVRDWTAKRTSGKGAFCMSAQEDNATLTALSRGAAAGRVDIERVAVLRSASDFSAPYPGQTDSDSIVNYFQQGGLGSSPNNLFLAAKPVIDAIVKGWSQWEAGVPSH